MNASFNHISLSNTVNCAQCQKTLSSCKCQPASFTSNLTSFTTSNYAANSNFNTGLTGTGYTGWQMTCSGCGNVLTSCSCNMNTPYIQNAPFVTPTITWPQNSWSTTTIDLAERINDYIVRAIQTEDEFPATGELKVVEYDKERGLYLKGSSLLLPIDYKECFYQLRRTAQSNLWQLRSPLTFRIDLAHKDAPQRQPHFFTLVNIDDMTTKGEKTVELTTPSFQEILDQLELVRLIEIQDTFTKLLRRL